MRLSLPRHLAAALLAAALLPGVAACVGPDSATASFDPAASCPAEGQMPGAYPDLEALVPADYQGRPPDSLDSGRICSAEALGALAEAGIAEVRFAGATWRTGGTSGLTLAVFEGDGLDAAEMLEFYAIPAESARRTEKLQRSDTTVGSAPAKRLDVLGSDGTGSTLVAWQVPGETVVRVLLAADIGDAAVDDLLKTLAGG
jgi:hypothetical protein